MRQEYKEYVDYKTAKEKQWNSKMMGFFDKAQVREQLAQQERDAELRQKIARQTFTETKKDTWSNSTNKW
jgi:hypothetical protein